MIRMFQSLPWIDMLNVDLVGSIPRFDIAKSWCYHDLSLFNQEFALSNLEVSNWLHCQIFEIVDYFRKWVNVQLLSGIGRFQFWIWHCWLSILSVFYKNDACFEWADIREKHVKTTIHSPLLLLPQARKSAQPTTCCDIQELTLSTLDVVKCNIAKLLKLEFHMDIRSSMFSCQDLRCRGFVSRG